MEVMGHIVLLVDDDQNVIHGLTRALRRQPYQLYTAQSGDEAVWILKAHDVDVIVTDEKMPGISGCDLIAWIAENYPEVVRIVLTGYATTETVIRAINEGGVFHFFTKPCRDLHLAIAIRKALEHKEQLKENLRRQRSRPQEAENSQRLHRALQTLAQVVSHDLHGPLRAVSDFCRSSEEEPREVFDPNARNLLRSALSAAAEVEQLVTDLLESCCTQTGPASEANSDANRAAQSP
jgi:two-component system probable response regulator PhcQ